MYLIHYQNQVVYLIHQIGVVQIKITPHHIMIMVQE